MIGLSCDNCNVSDVKIAHVEETIHTPFGDLEFEQYSCLRCKSLIDFVIYEYAELLTRISKKIESKRMELRKQTRDEMK